MLYSEHQRCFSWQGHNFNDIGTSLRANVFYFKGCSKRLHVSNTLTKTRNFLRKASGTQSNFVYVSKTSRIVNAELLYTV